MKILEFQPKLVEQVHDAILSEITAGRLQPGARIIQEQIAQELGVSRQPVQQALLLLRNQGVLRDAAGRDRPRPGESSGPAGRRGHAGGCLLRCQIGPGLGAGPAAAGGLGRCRTALARRRIASAQ